MINGIPVKLKAKDGQLETVFVATFRKCECLKQISKEIVKGMASISSYDRRVALVEKGYDKATTEEEMQVITDRIVTIRDEEDTANDKLFNLCSDFILKALLGAGYEKEDAERLSEIVPFDRTLEIMNACRTGVLKVLDFFTEKAIA